MGRKPNPRGKDRTRTISLDGDVAELAQKLADKSQLSAVLSQLLRQSYGISDELSHLEQALSTTIDERKNLQQKEAALIEEIEAARDSLIHRQNHILPSLYQRQGVLEGRLEDLRLKLNYLPQHESIKVMKQIDETRSLLEAVLEDIKELEA
jgi:chromosome segregation ATPase